MDNNHRPLRILINEMVRSRRSTTTGSICRIPLVELVRLSRERVGICYEILWSYLLEEEVFESSSVNPCRYILWAETAITLEDVGLTGLPYSVVLTTLLSLRRVKKSTSLING